MRYGFYLPTRGRAAAPDGLKSLVERAEALGFHSVVIGDHVVFPVRIASKYPYTVSGAFPGGGDALEQLTLATFVAAHTQRLRLVTSVMILPHRHPVLAAKMLATIDVLSRGRLTSASVSAGCARSSRRSAPLTSIGAAPPATRS
jgi:alkanesulfonate monooxygenase SsuD/methylene tetrahydromethanopterin reductase-like flavin-dependent oxidoreductase (luciferase family)